MIILFLTGCNVFQIPDYERLDRDMQNYFTWEKQQAALFDVYLGKSASEIEAIFGKPKEITRSNTPRRILPPNTDEVWMYGRLQISQGDFNEFQFRRSRLRKVVVR